MTAPFRLPLRVGRFDDEIADANERPAISVNPTAELDGDAIPDSEFRDYVIHVINAHDALVAACNEALTLLKTMTVQGFKAGADQDTRARLAAALAKARGAS